MKRKKILVVDDELSFTRLLKLNLDDTDAYELLIECAAERALGAARRFKPDLILLDVAMPRLNGGEVAALIRADAEVGTTPIIFLSATVGRQRVKELQGVIDGHPFIAKPASVEEIIEGIERHLAPWPVASGTGAGATVSELPLIGPGVGSFIGPIAPAP